jgi:peptidyl-prolyl cis-trans isomerase D
MFNLFRSRARATRYLLSALLLMVALMLVVTLIPGFGSGGSLQSDQVLAEVGGEPILIREAAATIRNQLKNNQVPRDMYEFYVPIVVNQMIADRAVAYEAARLGFHVSEEDLAASILSVIPGLAPDGKFVGKQAYEQYLAQMGVTINEFESTMKKQMLLIKMQNLLNDSILVSPREIEEQYRRKSEKIKFDYVLFDPAALRTRATVTDAEVKDYFERNRTVFNTPEKRAYDVLVVDEAKVAAALTIPESELRQAYDANRDRFRIPERVRPRHILLKTEGKPKDEAPKIKAKARELLKQIRGGADFAEIARKHSEDPGTAAKGGDLDWLVRGQMPDPNFEKATFSLKPKEISDVVETQYGFHIVQVTERELARVRPFEEVKAELAEERKRQAVIDRVQGLAEKGRAELVKNPAAAEQIASRLGIEFGRADSAAPGDPVPVVGLSDDLQQAVFRLPKGGVTEVIQAATGNRYIVAAVRDVFPPKPAPFEEVKEQIRSNLLDTASLRLARELAGQFAAKAREAGADFAAAARALKFEVKASPEMTRDSDLPQIGTIVTAHELFEKSAGYVGGPYDVAGKTIVCRLTAKIEPDLRQIEAERTRLLTEMRQNKARERKELFEDGIVSRLIDEGKVKINDAAIKRMVASFRG